MSSRVSVPLGLRAERLKEGLVIGWLLEQAGETGRDHLVRGCLLLNFSFLVGSWGLNRADVSRKE